MTKPIVAFHWLRVNGRHQAQQTKHTQAEPVQQPVPNKPKTTFTKIKNKLKMGGK